MQIFDWPLSFIFQFHIKIISLKSQYIVTNIKLGGVKSLFLNKMMSNFVFAKVRILMFVLPNVHFRFI